MIRFSTSVGSIERTKKKDNNIETNRTQNSVKENSLEFQFPQGEINVKILLNFNFLSGRARRQHQRKNMEQFLSGGIRRGGNRQRMLVLTCMENSYLQLVFLLVHGSAIIVVLIICMQLYYLRVGFI
jgi:hypothetical protein